MAQLGLASKNIISYRHGWQRISFIVDMGDSEYQADMDESEYHCH